MRTIMFIVSVFFHIALAGGGAICLAEEAQPATGVASYRKVQLSGGEVLAVTTEDNARQTATIHVYDPSMRESPVLLWSGRLSERPCIIRCLGENQLLASLGDTLYLIDTATATDALLIKGTPASPICSDGLSLYFVSGASSRDGYRCITVSGTTGAEERIWTCARLTNEVCRVTLGAESVVNKIDGLTVDSVLGAGSGKIWCITSDATQQLVKIDIQSGTWQAVMPLENQWLAPLTQISISPDERFIALAVFDIRRQLSKERDLVILDTVSSNRTVDIRNITSLSSDSFGGNAPRLSFGWFDNTFLCYGKRPFTIVNAATGDAYTTNSVAFVARASAANSNNAIRPIQAPVFLDSHRETSADYRWRAEYYQDRSAVIITDLRTGTALTLAVNGDKCKLSWVPALLSSQPVKR